MAKKFFSKALAVGLALTLCLSLLPMSAFAKDTASSYAEHQHSYTQIFEEHWCLIPGCPNYGEKYAHNFEFTDEVDLGSIGSYDTDQSHTVKCTECGYVRVKEHRYSDATCTAPAACECGHVKRGSQPLGHNLTHHKAVPATCTAPGTIEYWSCDRCNKNFSDAAGTTEVTSTVDPQKGHDFSGAYQEKGTGHWQLCMNGCGEYGNREAHSLTWTTTKKPTCSENGEEVGKCVCGHIERRTIPATGEHEYGDNGKCDCGAEDPNYKPEYRYVGAQLSGC